MLGQIEAINLVDLELRLKRMGLDLVRGGRRVTAEPASLRRDQARRPYQLLLPHGTAHRGRVPLVESLIDLRDSIENARFREVMSGVIESIQGA